MDPQSRYGVEDERHLSIKEVPDDVAGRLRQRAARNHRSLQGELMAIVEQAAAEPVPAARVPGLVRSWVHGWKTMEQLAAEREASGWKPHTSLATAPPAVDIIRSDRDRR